MWCQAFGPAELNRWYYGVRWYCGSKNYLTLCNTRIEVFLGTPNDFNRTGWPFFAGKYYTFCCNQLAEVVP